VLERRGLRQRRLSGAAMALALSAFHREQLAKYLRFFRAKREIQVSELKELFDDAAEARLDAGALLSADEVADLLRSLGDSVRSNFEEDLRRTVNMSVLAIQQLLEDADAQDVELQIDTSKIEDSHLVEEVEKLRHEVPAPSESARKTGRLVSLRDEQQRIIDQNAKLEAQVKALQRENDELQDQCNRSNNRLSNATFEVEALRRQVETLREDACSEEAKAPEPNTNSSSSVSALQTELDQERDVVVQLRAELADARKFLLSESGIDLEDIAASFKDSKQFQQLRKTLAQKTEQLTDLRRRLLAYEPDQTRVERDAREVVRVKHK